MASPILVTGGTGTLGRLVVARLRSRGRTVRVLSRRGHEGCAGVEFVVGDLATGEGVEAAAQGAEIIVHCAGERKGDEDKARRMVQAASRAGVQHLVYISVVGADRVPVASGIDRALFGYFQSKRDAEQIVADSGIPWSTLRAAQFHESLLLVARQMAKMPVIVVPSGFQFQPIEADEVASRLVELALGPPAGLAPEMAGPRAYGMAELLRVYLRAHRQRRPFLSVRLPGKAARAVRAGANLSREGAVGHRTWEDFVASELGVSRGAS